MRLKHFGTRAQRLEDPALLTGRGRFVDDIHLPGLLHAYFLRSPFAHAKIHRIDASRASAVPGVHAVHTWRELPEGMQRRRIPLPVPNSAIRHQRTQYPLAIDEVCYVGEIVAVVVAESRHIAEDAVPLIEVDYEPLPVSADCRTALELGAPLAHSDLPDNLGAAFAPFYGDVSDAFARARHVARVSLWQNRGGGHAIECRAVLARYDTLEDALTVWVAGQAPHSSKRQIADMLQHDANRVRVIMPDVGGGFGPKGIPYAEEPVIAACARTLRRPIKWTEDRHEHFLASTQERDQYWNLELALDEGGRILGLRGTLLCDNGAYFPFGIILPYIAATTTPGPYVIPSFHLDVKVVLTNKVATTPVRGAGRPQAVFAMERLMDKAAKLTGIDPVELRRCNLIGPERMPYNVGLIYRDGKPVTYDSGNYPACQAKAVALADYANFPARQVAARAQGRYIGIGIGNYVEGTGLGPFEGGTVRVMPAGRVTVITGTGTQGQGHRTAFAQLTADILGVEPHDIDFVQGDTALISMGVGTFASRVAVNAGSSIQLAAKAVRANIVKLVAHLLEADEQDIELAGGRAFVRGVEQMGKSFGELAEIAQGMPGFSYPEGFTAGLEDTQYFSPTQSTYCNGTHVAEVEVDVGTGGVRILRYVVAHDSGVLINPLIVDGQVRGGVAHGVGNALLEWMKYDEQAQPVTTTLADYLLPTASDVPNVVLTHFESPTPLNPLGVKGAGEGGTIPAAAAIIAAVESALSPFNIEITDTPVTPEKIVALLAKAGAYNGDLCWRRTRVC
jgi:carbon-monoxide dehydrogenase large subunit